MNKVKFVETYDEMDTIGLVESEEKSRVDGKYIIGMIEGQFFKPDGMSRNDRWYPKSLWESVLNSADVKNRLSSSTMFGEIGHSDGPVQDMTLRGGLASHFIDNLWIDEKGRGMGRAYILNTPTGNLLKTYLGAGCKLKVSTRGEGGYKEGCYHDGYPVVDDDYELQTVDFVLNPGFIETNATLKEQYLNIQTEKKEGEQTMDMDAYVAELKDELSALKAENKSLTEKLQTKEKELLKSQLDESADLKKVKEEFKPFKDMKVSAKTITETLRRSQKSLKKEQETSKKLAEELNAYKEKCGTLAQVDEAVAMSSKALASLGEYRKLGSVKEINEFRQNAENMIVKLKKIQESKKTSKPKINSKIVEEYKQYKQLGSVQEMNELVNNSQQAIKIIAETNELRKQVESLEPKLKELKEAKELNKRAFNTIKKYRNSVGTVAEARLLNKKNKNMPVKVNVKETLALSKKYGTTIESTAKLLRKYGSNKAGQMLEEINNKTKKVDEKNKLGSSTQLVEKVAQMDPAKTNEPEKTAKDFLSTGALTNYFNHDAFGKEIPTLDINDIKTRCFDNQKAATELLDKYLGGVDVEPEPKGLEGEKCPDEAEKEVKKLLK